MGKNSYEAVTRAAGSFIRAKTGIDLLSKYKVPFAIRQVLLPPNRGEINEFEAWRRKVTGQEASTYAMFFELRCRRDNVSKNAMIKKLRLTPQQGMKVLLRGEKEYIKEMRRFCAKFTRPPGNKIFSCGAGIGGGCVDAYGNFQPCLLSRHPDTVYNLKTGSLKKALTEFTPKLREKKAINPAYLSRCARCFLKGLCGQCPAKSWMEHGTLDTPVEYLCGMAHVQARFLGLIKESEKSWQIINWRNRLDKFCAKEEGR